MIKEPMPTLPKGAHLFAVNCETGKWFYINHANTWQGMPNPLTQGNKHVHVSA